MKEKITQNLLIAFMVIASGTMSLAQSISSNALECLAKLRKQPTHNPTKVASHDDFPSSSLYFEWNGADWDTLLQYTLVYNPNGNPTTGQFDQYSSGIFTPFQKDSYTYDANGNEIEQLQEVWNGTAWENNARERRSYDAQGNESEYLYESWTMGAWELNSGDRYTRQYNASNQIIEEISEYYYSGTSAWEINEKANYHFSAGVWDELVYHTWDGNAWQISARLTGLTWHNFAELLPASATFQAYSNGAYVDRDRSTCTYGQFDSQECISETYTTLWENSSKEIYEYDRLDNEVYYEYARWNGTWNFSSGFRSIYTYDTQDRALEVVLQEQLSPTNAINEFKILFSNFFTNAPSAFEANVNVTAFPNPVTDKLNFDLKLEKNGPVSIALFDIQGRKRLETMSNYNGNVITIPISTDLENGVYFYNLKMGEAFAKGKVIVQH